MIVESLRHARENKEHLPLAGLDRVLKNTTDVQFKALGLEDRAAFRLTDADGATVLPQVEVLFWPAPDAPAEDDDD